MALVVLLRGVNVGGHRTFRPAGLAKELEHLSAVNIGAAGTFVIRARVGRAELRTELARRLPFDTEIVICEGRDIVRIISREAAALRPAAAGIVRFVSVLVRDPIETPELPLQIPPHGEWLVRILVRDGRFAVGEYRRDMKTIGYLGTLDRIFGVPVTTRNWNTMTAIVKALEGGTGGRA
jgi:uncharacterized protein (DUF1697 family)